MPIFYALFENHLTSDPDDYSTNSADLALSLAKTSL
jgi:hypothetical protein